MGAAELESELDAALGDDWDACDKASFKGHLTRDAGGPVGRRGHGFAAIEAEGVGLARIEAFEGLKGLKTECGGVVEVEARVRDIVNEETLHRLNEHSGEAVDLIAGSADKADKNAGANVGLGSTLAAGVLAPIKGLALVGEHDNAAGADVDAIVPQLHGRDAFASVELQLLRASLEVALFLLTAVGEIDLDAAECLKAVEVAPDFDALNKHASVTNKLKWSSPVASDGIQGRPDLEEPR